MFGDVRSNASRSRRTRIGIYFEDDPGRRSVAKLLSKDEARRIAANTAKLPDLLQRRASQGVGLRAALDARWYRAQTPPRHSAHLRTARRVWRMVVLATQTPPTRVLPGPQP